MRPSSLYYRPLLPCQSLMFPASSSPSSSSLPLERCQWPSSPSSGKTTVSIEAAESLESLIAGSFALLRIIKPRVSMGWAQHARRRQHSTARALSYVDTIPPCWVSLLSRLSQLTRYDYGVQPPWRAWGFGECGDVAPWKSLLR